MEKLPVSLSRRTTYVIFKRRGNRVLLSTLFLNLVKKGTFAPALRSCTLVSSKVRSIICGMHACENYLAYIDTSQENYTSIFWYSHPNNLALMVDGSKVLDPHVGLHISRKPGWRWALNCRMLQGDWHWSLQQVAFQLIEHCILSRYWNTTQLMRMHGESRNYVRKWVPPPHLWWHFPQDLFLMLRWRIIATLVLMRRHGSH